MISTSHRTLFDGLGRSASNWIGTDDTPTSGFWSPSNLTGTNTVMTGQMIYDGGAVGDGNLGGIGDVLVFEVVRQQVSTLTPRSSRQTTAMG